MPDKPRVIDLFCGAGGISQGLMDAGFEIIWAIDNEKNTKITFEQNHGARAGGRLRGNSWRVEAHSFAHERKPSGRSSEMMGARPVIITTYSDLVRASVTGDKGFKEFNFPNRIRY